MINTFRRIKAVVIDFIAECWVALALVCCLLFSVYLEAMAWADSHGVAGARFIISDGRE